MTTQITEIAPPKSFDEMRQLPPGLYRYWCDGRWVYIDTVIAAGNDNGPGAAPPDCGRPLVRVFSSQMK